MTKLKQCPHCGGEVVRAWIADYPALRCDKCGIVTILPQSGAGNEKLIEVFNTRTPEIMRCGECSFYEAYDNLCKFNDVLSCSDWFCRYGRKREE